MTEGAGSPAAPAPGLPTVPEETILAAPVPRTVMLCRGLAIADQILPAFAVMLLFRAWA